MDIKQFDASNAYAAALGNVNKPGIGLGDAVKTSLEDKSAFSSLVSDSIGAVTSASGQLEKTSAKVLAGQASIVDVVTAASEAEMVVQTVTSVRDKVISAYNEIIKMPL